MKYLRGLPATKPRSRTAMTLYLSTHFRYHTMHSWNNFTTYANQVKFRCLDLTGEERNACSDMLNVAEAWDGTTWMIRQFSEKHKHAWQISFNGRSNGYLVLHMGGVHDGGGVFSWPGKSLDMGADFKDWTTEDLKSRTDLIWDFDQTCEACVEAYVEFAVSHRAEETEVLVPRTIKVAVNTLKGGTQ